MDSPIPRLFGDIRDITASTRVRIGFGPREQWRDAPAIRQAHSLTIQGHPVMEDWEEEYMQTLARIACMRGGTVLEIGFGMGISSRHIQTHPIQRHLIVEANRDVYASALEFARAQEHDVIPIFGFWEEVMPFLESESVDGILFDTYPLEATDIHANHFPFFKEAYRVLAPNGVLTYYSDEIEDFSPAHRERLTEAGFTSIVREVCLVTPPPDCLYWKSPTIVAPIVCK